MKIYYCKIYNCNKKITYWSHKYGSGLCKSCSMKNLFKNPKNHPMFGHKHTKLAKEKNSIAHKGRTMDLYHTNDCNCGVCKAKRGEYKMEGNPNWKDGISFKPYPLGWNKTCKEQIRYRDSYKCQICGCHEVECGRRLDIHHIDYNKNNLNPNNLISLCHSCHIKTNYNRESWIGYLGNKLL